MPQKMEFGARRAALSGLMACFCAVFAVATFAGQVDDSTKPFPDEWFFSGSSRPSQLRSLEGKPAPTLELGEWIGTPTSLEASKGKVVVIDFWATWCGPCMAAIPHNVDLVDRYGKEGLVFIGVHDSNNGWNSAAQVVQDMGINYPVVLDSAGASVKNYNLQFWPTYVVIDRAGRVRAAGLTPDRVEDVVKVLLAEDAPSGATRVNEFGPEVYYGGERRPKAFREAEGKELPEAKPQAWHGTEVPKAAFDRSVLVLTFVSPFLSRSVDELGKLTSVQKEMGTQGVVFAGVCDTRAGEEAWALLDNRRTDVAPTIPIMRDSAGKEDNTAGALAEALGIKLFPSTVVIDRAGVVRAAGVRADQLKPILEKLIAEPVPPGS